MREIESRQTDILGFTLEILTLNLTTIILEAEMAMAFGGAADGPLENQLSDYIKYPTDEPSLYPTAI